MTWIKDLQFPLPHGASYSVYIGWSYIWRVTLIMNWNLARTRATCGIFVSWPGIHAPCNGMVKKLSGVWETLVQSPDGEDPLEKEMVIHSSILAWEIPWTEKPSGLQSKGSQRIRHDWMTNTFTFSLFLHPAETISKGLWIIIHKNSFLLKKKQF